jgi:ferrous iron transport protein A
LPEVFPCLGDALAIGHNANHSHFDRHLVTQSMTPDVSDRTLDGVPLHESFKVTSVRSPIGAPDWAQRLEEIGFAAGERVMLMARGVPGGDPLVVRIGLSTFALRAAEAACVQVRPIAAVPGTA